MKTFSPALEALPTRETLSHRERRWAEARRQKHGASARDLSRRVKLEEKWETFARAYSSELPDRVASDTGATNRVLTRTDQSAAEEPTT